MVETCGLWPKFAIISSDQKLKIRAWFCTPQGILAYNINIKSEMRLTARILKQDPNT